MKQELRKEIALFRYSLIAPLITNTYSQKSAKEYLQFICAKKHETPKGSLREYAPETLKGWLTLYRRYGIDGLYPKKRSDKNQSRKLAEKARQFIVAAKVSLPKRSAVSIYHEMIARGIIKADDLSVSTVQRYISRGSIATKELSQTVERKAFEFKFPNECWQSDISVGPYIIVNGHKQKTYIIAFLDDATRLILHCEAFYQDSFLSLLSAFKSAVAKKGIPKKLFVDNGKVYQSDQMHLICASIGTILCFARPYSPESKGKIERWFGTLHRQWSNTFDWKQVNSLELLNESLFKYVHDYNNTVHSSTGQKPIDKYTKHINDIKFVRSKQQLDYLFLYRVVRKVKNDASISLNNRIMEVPQKYIGEYINIRYDPVNVDKAFIFSEDGICLETIYPVKKIDNSKIMRNQNINPVDFSVFSTRQTRR